MTEPQWTTIERGEFALACIVCDKALENWAQSPNQPCDGLAFYSNGHYPSSMFDAMGGGHLEISICEECMVAKAERQIAFVPPRNRGPAIELKDGMRPLNAEELEGLLKGLEYDLSQDDRMMGTPTMIHVFDSDDDSLETIHQWTLDNVKSAKSDLFCDFEAFNDPPLELDITFPSHVEYEVWAKTWGHINHRYARSRFHGSDRDGRDDA